MAKGGYVGIDGIAHKIKNGYVGVDGVARKIKKAYVGVNGVARLIYALDEQSYTITFNANTGEGSMSTITVSGSVVLPSNTFSKTGYNFTGWNTKADGTGTSYSNGQTITPTSNITLYAQWTIKYYSVVYKHTNHTNLYGDDETGHKECYALFINGVEQPDFGDFSAGSSTTYSLPHGTTIRVVVSNYNPNEVTYDDINCDVYWNGTSVAKGYRGTEYTFTLTSGVTIDFRWKIAGSLVTFNMQSWEDCYITTN